MAIRVTKNDKESTDRMIQRFNRKVQQSRLVQKVRNERYHQRKPSKRRLRDAAMMRAFYRAEREKMKFY